MPPVLRPALASFLRKPSDFRWFPLWARTMSPGWSPLEAGLPWLTFSAIAWLRRYVRLPMAVFEYGAGGSTVFFARRARHVTSVEHDPDFGAKVRARLDRLGLNNVRFVLQPPAPIESSRPYGPASYTSTFIGFENLDFSSYVQTIRVEEDGSLDVVSIDGRARASCIREAAPKVAPGGVLVLDNAERPEYRSARAELRLSDWELMTFRGLGPCGPYRWETAIYQRRNDLRGGGRR